MLSLSVRALLCGVAAVALAGCATGRGAQTPQDAPPARVTLADMKNAQDAQAQEIARLAGDVKAMDAQQAFLVAEIKNLSEQIAKLKSSLSEAEGAMRSLRATPVPPESRPAPPFVPPPPAALAPVPIPAPAPRPAAPAATAPAAPLSRNAEADRIFAAALAKLRAGDDGQAALEFTEFVVQYPTHPQAAAAQNHIGEAYYRQGDFRQALGEFQKTVDGYTQAVQVSEALLKIGLCQRSLGDPARAKASWERVVKQFPKSDAARQARTLLAARPAGGR
ncbi:MAG: tol-pal system protein YbgF [Candidatus Rokubacteria bacterium]|nr:tol-pal system protein YbgF [Candidatus Rokubacteria bacterium]